MSADVLTCESEMARETIDKYLTEDDKSFIFQKMKSNSVRPFPNSDLFHLYRVANQVKDFMEHGHYVQVLGYGIDSMVDDSSEGFLNVDIDSKDFLDDLVGEYFYEIYQDHGFLDDDLLDMVWIWMQMTPYAVMAMTEPVRKQLQKTVDILWTCTFSGSKALSTHSYEVGGTMMKDIIGNWSTNLPFTRPRCGYDNIIKPREY